MSPTTAPPLIALSPTSKFWKRSTSAVLVERSRLVLESSGLDPLPRGVHRPFLPGCRNSSRTLPCRWPRVQSVTPGPPVRFIQVTRAEARSTPIIADAPPMRSSHPSAFAAVDSDLHRVCLTRLCSTFRFSQPLGALLRPQPVQPCFVPVTLLGFPRLQRFPPAGSWSSSHDETCPSCRFYARRSRRHRGGAIADASAAPGMRAPGGSVVAGRCYPVIRARSSPDVPSSRS
jgi:hypothetical protein